MKYLEEQANSNDIQVIITTHSTTIAAATSLKKITCLNILEDEKYKITSLRNCQLEVKAEKFLNRWLDATKSTLLFSKGVILVEGLAEALLVPKLAEIYLREIMEKTEGIKIPGSLEEAGVSVINMNGIYFQYFMQLYRGYQLILPEQESNESKEKYKIRAIEFVHKEEYVKGEYVNTDFIPIHCVAITDNDPDNALKPSQKDIIIGNNPQLFMIKQLDNMTNNCRVFTNLKTFEYDMALSSDNAKLMIEIILDNLITEGDIKKRMEKYLELINAQKSSDMEEIAFDLLSQIDSNYLGKGLFAQILSDKLNKNSNFQVPEYIKNAIKFVLGL